MLRISLGLRTPGETRTEAVSSVVPRVVLLLEGRRGTCDASPGLAHICSGCCESSGRGRAPSPERHLVQSDHSINPAVVHMKPLFSYFI